MMRRITKPERAFRRLFLHAALVAGSILFAIPFIWLGSTSAKVADEMYPPRWLPEIPGHIVRSPYIQMRESEIPKRPLRVTEEDWERLTGPIQDGIRMKIAQLGPELPEFYGPYLDAPDLTLGVFSRLLKRAPDELFEKVVEVPVSWFAQNVTADVVEEMFEDVYRRVAFSDVVFYGWDVSVEQPTTDEALRFPWRVIKGDVKLITRTEGLRRAAQEAEYSFEKEHGFALQCELPLRMAPENLKKFVVSNRADRSWHEMQCTIEMAGKKYTSVQPAFLGSDRWQDTTWQFKSPADDSIEMKTWLRVEPEGSSEYAEPGRVRLTVEVREARGLGAMFNKYANNYRDVLRMVPLGNYVRNSLFLVILNITGQVIGSSLVAFSFARLKWPARDFCFMLVLATLMIPAQVTMIPVFLIFKNLGWYNTLRPLWVPSFFGSAFYIFLLRQFMKSIPNDLEDSAKIDGCGYFGIYTRIILPLIKPALATIGIFTFMGCWNDFMGPLIYLNDQRLYPLSLGLFALQVFQAGNYGLMMAASVLMTLPVILLFFAAQRQFIQGVTLTGMKG